MTSKYYTYLYCDPKDGTPIYVGKGHKKRAYAHFGRCSKSHLSNLIKKRIKEGYVVEPIINYEADETTALEMEKFWIDFYGRADLGKGTLFNLTDGGEGTAGAVRSDAFKRNLSIIHTGKEFNEETRALISKKAKQRKHSDETKEILSAIYKGKKRPLEHCQRISEGQKGRKPSQETIDKIAAANTGKKRSAEARAKMSAAAKNRKRKL